VWARASTSATPEGAEAARRLHATLAATDAAGYIASCEAVAAIDFRESNRNIRTPSLVIAGDRDEATPPSMSETIADAIPGAKLARIDAAHLSAVERPVAFAQLLIDFWRSL
jgi:3-oxoadipate enol-lactonase